jgi:hypothetical protein
MYAVKEVNVTEELNFSLQSTDIDFSDISRYLGTEIVYWVSTPYYI